jgi:hypothetical protein
MNVQLDVMAHAEGWVEITDKLLGLYPFIEDMYGFAIKSSATEDGHVQFKNAYFNYIIPLTKDKIISYDHTVEPPYGNVNELLNNIINVASDMGYYQYDATYAMVYDKENVPEMNPVKEYINTIKAVVEHCNKLYQKLLSIDPKQEQAKSLDYRILLSNHPIQRRLKIGRDQLQRLHRSKVIIDKNGRAIIDGKGRILDKDGRLMIDEHGLPIIDIKPLPKEAWDIIDGIMDSDLIQYDVQFDEDSRAGHAFETSVIKVDLRKKKFEKGDTHPTYRLCINTCEAIAERLFYNFLPDDCLDNYSHGLERWNGELDDWDGDQKEINFSKNMHGPDKKRDDYQDNNEFKIKTFIYNILETMVCSHYYPHGQAYCSTEIYENFNLPLNLTKFKSLFDPVMFLCFLNNNIEHPCNDNVKENVSLEEYVYAIEKKCNIDLIIKVDRLTELYPEVDEPTMATVKICVKDCDLWNDVRKPPVNSYTYTPMCSKCGLMTKQAA